MATSHRPGAFFLIAAIGLSMTHALAQTRSAADGPWSGWVQCELTAQLNEQGRSYSNQQTHTWVLTATSPASGTDIKEYPAMWTVAGGGTSQRQEGNGRTVADKWNTAGQPMPTTISVRVDLTGTLFIALRGAQLRSVGAMTGTSVAHSNNGNTRDQQTPMLPLTIDEFRFPVIRDDGTKTSIIGSTEPTPAGALASGQPPRTVSNAACSWNLVRGGGTPPPPPSGRSITRDQVAPPAAVSSLIVPGTPPPAAQPIAGTRSGRADAGPVQTTPAVVAVPGAKVDAGPVQTSTGGRADAGLSRTTTGGFIALGDAVVPKPTILAPATLVPDRYLRCQIDVDGGADYNDHQTHTWAIRSGATPTSAGVYEATWYVSGQGYRAFTTPTNPAAPLVPPILNRDSWTYTVAGISAPISIVSGASGVGVSVSLAHQPMTAQAGGTGTESHRYTALPGWCGTQASFATPQACFVASADSSFSVAVPEFQFARIDVPGTIANGSRLLVAASTSVPVRGTVLQWQPTTAKATASCSWNLDPPPTPSSSSGLSTPPPSLALPAGTVAAAVPAGTGGTADSTGLATLNPNAVACSTTFPTVTTKATPGGVTFSWLALSGATYRVSRKDLGVVTPTPITQSPYTHTAAIDYRTPYQYSIMATFADNRCATTSVSVTGPKPLVPQVTATVTQSKVHLAWGVQADRPTSYLVLGPGLNNDGAEVAVAATGQSIDIDNLPGGTHEWLVAPLWKTPAGIMSDVTTAAHAKATIVAPPPPPRPPGPPPTGIRLQAFPNSDVISSSCNVRIEVTWAPAPGATGYTVYGENGPISERIPLTTFSFFYRQKDMRLSDLLTGGALSAIYAVAGAGDYANQPQFRRGVQVKVAASFADRSDGVSAFVPLAFSTYPCSDGRNFPSDP